MHALEIEATVSEKNQLTIPRAVAERHGIAPGQRLVIVDDGRGGDSFVVRVLPRSYAGSLAGLFGSSTDENVDFVRREREEWR